MSRRRLRRYDRAPRLDRRSLKHHYPQHYQHHHRLLNLLHLLHGAPTDIARQSHRVRRLRPFTRHETFVDYFPLSDVRNDGQDHQLLANLQKLGAVQVPRGKITYQKSNPMLNILAAREKNSTMEDEANTAAQRASQGVNNIGSIKNRLNAQTIVALLDERKECKSRREVEQLAVAYDLDIAVLDQLARYVNSPSVAEGRSAALLQRRPVNVEDDSEVCLVPDLTDCTFL